MNQQPASDSEFSKLVTADGLTEAARRWLDLLPCQSFFIDRSGDVTYASPAFEELIGDVEVLGVGLAQIVQPDDLARAMTLREAALSDAVEATYEARVKAADGEWVKLTVHHWPAFDAAGVLCGGLSVAIGIESVKRGDGNRFAQVLTEGGLTDQVREAFDLFPMGIYVVRANGELAFVNRAISDHFENTEMTDPGWAAIVHPDDFVRLASLRSVLISDGRDAGAEVRLGRPDGTYTALATRAYGASDESGESLGWLGLSFAIDGISRSS